MKLAEDFEKEVQLCGDHVEAVKKVLNTTDKAPLRIEFSTNPCSTDFNKFQVDGLPRGANLEIEEILWATATTKPPEIMMFPTFDVFKEYILNNVKNVECSI